MSEFILDKATRKKIIQGTYKCFRNKELNGKSRATTITEIVNMIKKEVRENAD